MPKWIEEELSRWTSKHGKGYLNVFKALAIAWEALEEAKNDQCPCGEVLCKSHISKTAEEAMRRIEEMNQESIK